jgi:hypothetical protein
LVWGYLCSNLDPNYNYLLLFHDSVVQLPALLVVAFVNCWDQVLVETMKGVTVQGSGNLTNPLAAHDYPEILNFHWQNGSDTVDLSAAITAFTMWLAIEVAPVAVPP